MNQSERRAYLTTYLIKEQGYQDISLPESDMEQKRLLRSLMNVRMPGAISDAFLKIQDEYLQKEREQKKITVLSDLEQVQPDLYIWKGDITLLAVDAIVNAANSQMTGCYQPCHSCIDNCIHTYAGIQLRTACGELMQKQGHEEATGQAKITKGYNLPCRYVIHTVGPIVNGPLSHRHREQLRSCYESCLRAAQQKHVESIAFCCISTGVFMFPNEEAAQIAVDTVRRFKQTNKSQIKVVFNVFKEEDERIYKDLLQK